MYCPHSTSINDLLDACIEPKICCFRLLPCTKCTLPLLLISPRVCVCVCAKCDPFLPSRSHFFFKRPENFVRIAKFPYAAFGPLFAFHCPIFFTKNNTLNGVCMLNVTAAH